MSGFPLTSPTRINETPSSSLQQKKHDIFSKEWNPLERLKWFFNDDLIKLGAPLSTKHVPTSLRRFLSAQNVTEVVKFFLYILLQISFFLMVRSICVNSALYSPLTSLPQPAELKYMNNLCLLMKILSTLNCCWKSIHRISIFSWKSWETHWRNSLTEC